MEPTNHPFRKENNLHDYVPAVNLQGCMLGDQLISPGFAKLRFSFNLLLHFVAFFVVGTRLGCLLHNPKGWRAKTTESTVDGYIFSTS